MNSFNLCKLLWGSNFYFPVKWGNKENQQNKTKQTLFLHLGLLPGLGFIQKGQSWTTTRKHFGLVSHHLSQAQTTAHWKPYGKKHPERFALWRACLRHFSRQVPGDHPLLIAASLSLSRQTLQSHHEKVVSPNTLLHTEGFLKTLDAL